MTDKRLCKTNQGTVAALMTDEKDHTGQKSLLRVNRPSTESMMIYLRKLCMKTGLLFIYNNCINGLLFCWQFHLSNLSK